MALKMLKKST